MLAQFKKFASVLTIGVNPTEVVRIESHVSNPHITYVVMTDGEKLTVESTFEATIDRLQGALDMQSLGSRE